MSSMVPCGIQNTEPKAPHSTELHTQPEMTRYTQNYKLKLKFIKRIFVE